MTYRELLDAIRTANRLQDARDIAASARDRWRGTPEERDIAEARFYSADARLDQQIDG